MSELKNSAVFHFIGTIDELNSHLGLVKALFSSGEAVLPVCHFIEKIQHNLMKLMSHASDVNNNEYFFLENEVTELEKEIDKLSENLPKLTGFVLPGKNIMEAQIQIARSIARRAERFFFTVNEEHVLCTSAGEYLNKLSGYLFVLSQQESLKNLT